MDPRVRNAIARVDVERDGVVISRGTACLVGDRLAVTALHVVADRMSDPPQILGDIRLTFPDPGPHSGGHGPPSPGTWTTLAMVAAGKWNPREDWVLLRCDVQPPPDLRPLPLGMVTRGRDEWETYGFPDAHPDGMVCRGTIEHRDGTYREARAHQLFCHQAAAGDGMPVKGLSGAPVLVDGAVVGVMRTSLLKIHPEGATNVGGTLYACPSTVIADACPEEFPEPLPKVSATPRWKQWVAAAAGLVVLLGGALGYYTLRPDPPDPMVSQQIVIDTSERMGAIFPGGKSKLVEAVEALKEVTLLQQDNLALRTYGGECNQADSSRLLVNWGTNRDDDIKGAATQENLRLGGQPTLVQSLAAAITDVGRLRNTRRIIVLTGGDKCPTEDLGEISFRLKSANMTPEDLDVRLIGLGVSPEEEAWLKQVAETVSGEVYVAQTTAQLNQVLEWVLNVQPAVEQVQDVWKIVDGVNQTANEFVTNINARKFDDAERFLDNARTIYNDRAIRRKFEEAARGLQSVNFQKFYKLASDNRVLQEQYLAVGRDLLREGKASGGEQQSPELVETIEKWNEVMSTVNANLANMNELTQTIVKEGRNQPQKR